MIYFVEMEGTHAIKIGFTAADDVQQRIRQLQTGQPSKLLLIGTMPGDKLAERGLHEAFAELRGNGEWFKDSAALRWLIRVMLEYGLPWTFCRAYSLLEPWKEEILSEMAKDQTWKDKQIASQHLKIKRMRARIIELEALLSEKPDDLVSRYQECWGLLGQSVSAVSDARR